MSIEDRLQDAELLRDHGREDGALLSLLVAVAALARLEYPNLGDRVRFETLLRQYHKWTIEVEFRGSLVDTDHLLYKWLRCHLVHEAAMPPDIRIDHTIADPTSLTVRAGGPPEHTVLLSPGWLQHLTDETKKRLAQRTNPKSPAGLKAADEPTNFSCYAGVAPADRVHQRGLPTSGLALPPSLSGSAKC